MNDSTGSRGARVLRELRHELPRDPRRPSGMRVTLVHVDQRRRPLAGELLRPPMPPAPPRDGRVRVDYRPLVLPMPTYTGPARELGRKRIAIESPIFAEMLRERRGRWPGQLPTTPLALTAGGAR